MRDGRQPPIPARARLLRMVLYAMAAKSVYAAAELGLADLMAERPRTSAELAERTGTHGPSLRRLLLTLAGLGVVNQLETDLFELADLGKPLRKDGPDSVSGLLRTMCGPEVWRSWDGLVSSVRTGEPAWNLVHGISWTEYYDRNPEPSATFNLAMAEQTRDAAPGILAATDFSRFHTVVDVGGGDGTLIAHLLRANHALQGVVFDAPAGLATAAKSLAAAGVASRCRVVGGDFFDSVPEGADAYLLKLVLHDWDDERATAILRNVRAAMRPGSRLLIVERRLPELATTGSAGARSFLHDLHMLVVTGGRERTEQEFRRLLGEAGFEVIRRTEPLPPYDFQLIEAAPA